MNNTTNISRLRQHVKYFYLLYKTNGHLPKSKASLKAALKPKFVQLGGRERNL